MDIRAVVIPLGVIAAVAAVWFLVTRLLRLLAGMSGRPEADKGGFLRESPWGSGFVNWMGGQGCFKVLEHERGWAVRLFPVLGGGELWLPKGRSVVEKDAVGFLPVKNCRIRCGGDRALLFGRLADFVGRSAARS